MKNNWSSRTRRGRFVAGLIVVVGGAFALGRATAPARHEAGRPAEATSPVEQVRERWYTCSMHPQIRSRDPKEKCPICGMDLIPVPDDGDEEDAGDGVPRLRVSARSAALMEIETVPARRARVEREIPLYGRVEPDERRVKTISAWAAGRIDRLLVNFRGEGVRAGQPMLELYSPPLIAAQEELIQAVEAARRLASADPDSLSARTAREGVQAARDKLRLLGLTAGFIDEVETTGRVRDRVEIPAPLDGVVTARHVSLGEYVETGQPLFSVADLTNLWVRLSVFESDLAFIRAGRRAEFTTVSYPGRTFSGTVSFIDPVLDERTRSVLVRIDVPNEDGLLKPGMFVGGVVRAAVEDENGAHAGHDHDAGALPLVIPASAPLLTGERAVVYVRVADADRPTFEPRDVVLGPRAGSLYVVRQGLEEGDLVVVHGNFRIDSELQIRGRPSMMAPEGGAAPSHQHGPGDAGPSSDPRDHADVGQVRTPDHRQPPEEFAAEVVELFERYLALTAALARDDFAAAKPAALALGNNVRMTDLGPLDEAQREAWRAVDDRLRSPLDAMAEATDIEGLRTRLPALTEAVSAALRQFAGTRAGTVWRARCPMAFGNKGADWLQREERIANPYFGASMLRCGTAKVEIGARGTGGTR